MFTACTDFKKAGVCTSVNISCIGVVILRELRCFREAIHSYNSVQYFHQNQKIF